MASEVINPIRFARQVNEQFINYQLTAFPLTDPELAEQARKRLKDSLGNSPLIKGPYVSLSRTFKMGSNLNTLAETGVVHPALPGLTEYPDLFAHQEEALRQIQKGNHCIIATGTGSGKTEAFLYPILDYCLHLRDQNAPDGVVAVLVYPMNALALDQLDRLRRMLAGSGISFGMYVGSTAADEAELGNVVRMKAGEGRDAIPRYEKKHKGRDNLIISPAEERLTEKEMSERPPRLLLTNVNQLELLLTRGKDLGMFVNAPLKYLVFDEAHTYSGAVGAEVACLIRRLRSFCGKGPDEVICIGTSATVTDPKDEGDEVAQFAHRFFGVDPDRVSLVKEQYQNEVFPSGRFVPDPPKTDTVELLDKTLKALESGDEGSVRRVVKELTGRSLSTQKPWPEALYESFKQNEYVYAIFHSLQKPEHLNDAVRRIANHLGRGMNQVSEQAKGELLCYLALGAAAERAGNPLLRPKVHYFVKGLEGAVAVFVEKPGGSFYPELHLSLEEAMERHAVAREACPPVVVCVNCGQHYFEGYYRNFAIGENNLPMGGEAEGNQQVWLPADEVEGGRRVLFTNRLLSEDGGDDAPVNKKKKKKEKKIRMHFCRYCGALHYGEGTCQNTKCKRNGNLVPIWVLNIDEGVLFACLSCGHRSRKSIGGVVEPVRPFQATTVADVHILAQNMINAVRGPQQKLIVFTDNRQDAAFQAGWMQDHARRYRIRHLIYDSLRDQPEPISIQDIQDDLLRQFRDDPALGRTLAPEVYSGRTEEAFGRGLEELLRKYLRILLVREFAIGFREKDGLESWGLVRTVYKGVEPEHPWIRRWAEELEMSPELLAEGIASLLDSYRRTRIFWDEQADIFSRYWHESNEEVQRGFLPYFDFPPKGLKEWKETGDRESCIQYFRSSRGQTRTVEFISKWNLPKGKMEPFLDALWKFLVEETGVLAPVTLKNSKNVELSGTRCFQVHSSKMGILPQYKRFRCNVCQRVHTRRTPNDACTGWHCKGRLVPEEPPADDYNIEMLNLPFSMLMAREHSAQVPAKEREKIEEAFKNEHGRINCLVATPTLEMGVDIGALDMVLMRNVPPKPANYWQRAGRAGRRHRMAVIYTYCRRSQHDRYFFDDPLGMLDGFIETPKFNLRNEVMIRKHVHATVLSEIIRLSRAPEAQTGLDDVDAAELSAVYRKVFPPYINRYLFEDERNYRLEPYDVSDLRSIVRKYENLFFQAVRRVFAAYWPEEDSAAVSDKALLQYIREMPDLLQEVLNRLHKRMMWSVHKRRELLSKEDRGLLSEEEIRLRNRCERYLKQLTQTNMSTYTLTVLAVEGFLPGYGIYQGSIRAFAGSSAWAIENRPDFELPRPPSIAIREFVPGNLIYANNGRFRISLFHFPVGEQQIDPDRYVVDVEREMVREAKRSDKEDGRYGHKSTHLLPGLPICDVNLSYVSRITDEESNRFQLPVTVMGYLKKSHRGMKVYRIGSREVQHRFGQHTRLINVGPADKVKQQELGYPVCTVCGGVRSPYASKSELDHFEKHHLESCGKLPMRIAFSTDSRVDGLLFQGLEGKEEAVNLGEALRIGANRLLEMDEGDLQYLMLPQADESYHLFLYDPMPGGSGLLQQILERWRDVLQAGIESLANCKCERSCYRCMRTYRNVFVHSLLDRVKAIELLQGLLYDPKLEREMEPVITEEDFEVPGQGSPTNRVEYVLAEMLSRAGFPEFQHQREIRIGRPFRTTTPDLYYEDVDEDIYVAIYLDGLSKNIHGNEQRVKIDRMIREQLEAEGIDVIEIAASDLDDPQLMRRHFKRIAAKMRRRDLRERMERDLSWFND